MTVTDDRPDTFETRAVRIDAAQRAVARLEPEARAVADEHAAALDAHMAAVLKHLVVLLRSELEKQMSLLTGTLDYAGFHRVDMVVEAVFARDFPVVQAGVLFSSALFVLSNLLVDVSYGIVDPRIRHD